MENVIIPAQLVDYIFPTEHQQQSDPHELDFSTISSTTLKEVVGQYVCPVQVAGRQRFLALTSPTNHESAIHNG
jgi:hypothetical protein